MKRLLNTLYFLVCAGLIIYIGVRTKSLLTDGHAREKPESGSALSLSLDAFPQQIKPFTLPTADGASFSFPADLKESFVLFVPFTTHDCYLCYREIELWNTFLPDAAVTIKVIGVLADATPQQARYFIEKQDIRIPVVLDDGTFFETNRIQGKVTPLKILATREGYLLDVSGTTYNQPALKEKYFARLKNVLGEVI